MPTITKTVSALHPNTNNNPSWFSFVRNTYSQEHRGRMKAPTISKFERAWSRCNANFVYEASGDDLERCKRVLRRNYFTQTPQPRDRDAQQARLWVTMIQAFNMYAAVRREFGITPNHNVDFIGSAGDTHPLRNKWRPRFHGRCVLHLADSTLQEMSRLLETEESRSSFWDNIFDLYDRQSFQRRLQYPAYMRNMRNNQRASAQNSPPLRQGHPVDNPTHLIAQEYMNRTEDQNEEIIPSRSRIIEMIRQTENQLPSDLWKMLYDICVASQISHPIESQTTAEENGPAEMSIEEITRTIFGVSTTENIAGSA